jgi:transcription initiation factor IIE alpha subunit
MNEAIDNAAGIVWKFLNEKGASSVTKIANETGVNKNDLHRAIGWLAREDKLAFETKGRTETIALK